MRRLRCCRFLNTVYRLPDQLGPSRGNCRRHEPFQSGFDTLTAARPAAKDVGLAARVSLRLPAASGTAATGCG